MTQNLDFIQSFRNRLKAHKLEAEALDVMKRQIINGIELGEYDDLRDGDKIIADGLTITSYTVKRWGNYSDAVKQLQEQEQLEGIAKLSSTLSYRFNLSD